MLKGTILSRNFMCSGPRDTTSASIFACKCSTFRQPMTGKTYGALCNKYAIVTMRDREKHPKLKDQRELTCLNVLRANLLCDFCKCQTHTLFVFSPFPAAEHTSSRPACLYSPRFFLVHATLSRDEYIPGSERHPCNGISVTSSVLSPVTTLSFV